MSENNKTSVNASSVQLAYAQLLDVCTKVTFVVILVLFAVYMAGIIKPSIPLNEMPSYWKLPLGEYLQKTGSDTGWSWVNMLNKSDYLCFGTIALLSSISILCYIRIIPLLAKKKDTAYVIIVVTEILVLLLAASGILTSGH